MQSLMRTIGVVVVAFLLALPGFGLGCRSAGGNAPSAAENAGPASTASPEAARPSTPLVASTSTPVPAAGKAEDAGAAPAAQAAKAATGIQASTKRSAAGLPDTLPDYLSWTPLEKLVGVLTSLNELGHPGHKKAYASFPKGEVSQAPYPPGTICLLEEMETGKDFIYRISVMTKAEDGWKFSAYARQKSTEAFAAVSGAATSQCASCHTAGKDSVFLGAAP